MWWVATFSFLMLPEIWRNMGPMDAARRRTKWHRLLVYFGVGLSIFGLAVVFLSTESVLLWVAASALLLVSVLWNVYALRLLAYGRISRIEQAEQGSGT